MATRYDNLPEFIFKEFVEVEDVVEAQDIIKDGGFRKNIVTSIGVTETN